MHNIDPRLVTDLVAAVKHNYEHRGLPMAKKENTTTEQVIDNTEEKVIIPPGDQEADTQEEVAVATIDKKKEEDLGEVFPNETNVLVVSPGLTDKHKSCPFGVVKSHHYTNNGAYPPALRYKISFFQNEVEDLVEFFATEVYDLQRILSEDVQVGDTAYHKQSGKVLNITRVTVINNEDRAFGWWRDGVTEKCEHVSVKDLYPLINSFTDLTQRGKVQQSAKAPNTSALFTLNNSSPSKDSSSQSRIGYGGSSSSSGSAYSSTKTGIPVIDNHTTSKDPILVEIVGGGKFTIQLTPKELLNATKVLDFEIIECGGDDNVSKDVVKLILPLERARFSKTTKEVLCCAFDATNEYMQTMGFGKLGFAARTWYKAHPKTVSSGLPAAFTFSTLNELVAPYGLGISRIFIKKGLAAWEDTKAWEEILGVNPAASMDKTVSNADFIDMMGGPEMAAMAGYNVNDWRLEYVDNVPSDIPRVGMAGASGGFASGGGHASFYEPRQPMTNWTMALQYDRIENCNWKGVPPVFEYADGDFVLNLDIAECLDVNGKRLKVSVYDNMSIGPDPKIGYWWDPPTYKSYTPASSSHGGGQSHYNYEEFMGSDTERPKGSLPLGVEKKNLIDKKGNSSGSSGGSIAGNRKLSEWISSRSDEAEGVARILASLTPGADEELSIIQNALSYDSIKKIVKTPDKQPFWKHSKMALKRTSIINAVKSRNNPQLEYIGLFTAALGYNLDSSIDWEYSDFHYEKRKVDVIVDKLLIASKKFEFIQWFDLLVESDINSGITMIQELEGGLVTFLELIQDGATRALTDVQIEEMFMIDLEPIMALLHKATVVERAVVLLRLAEQEPEEIILFMLTLFILFAYV